MPQQARRGWNVPETIIWLKLPVGNFAKMFHHRHLKVLYICHCSGAFIVNFEQTLRCSIMLMIFPLNWIELNALLFKMRKYVSLKILKSIYFAIFDSYLSYCCLVWAQNFSTIQRIVILLKKAVRIINEDKLLNWISFSRFVYKIYH